MTLSTKRPRVRGTPVFLATLILLTVAGNASAAHLHAEITWDTPGPIGIHVDDENNSNQGAISALNWGLTEFVFCNIPGGTISSMTYGYGPVTFDVDPLYGTTFWFGANPDATVSYVPVSTNVRLRISVDGTLVSDTTTRVDPLTIGVTELGQYPQSSPVTE